MLKSVAQNDLQSADLPNILAASGADLKVQVRVMSQGVGLDYQKAIVVF